MKVLFAVSNEEISESIVKKYQKEYKQIISYKNVYYFNAILKELQKDKTYDRVVISEDLEAFTHTQYDQIDKFLFDILDSISDEASNSKGNDIPIIMICSDRRTKSEEMLIKLFGIGIYNAIIGTDRSVDEVCRLINRPRSKKEAKNYYKIESENVNYQSENENDVSEVEIQNILAHYKRLGKNEERYLDSFNNIAAQYNDTQLRIISKFLPLNVRAVLEEKSTKYQQIMSFNNSVSDSLRNPKKEISTGPSEKLLVPKTKEKIMSKPVVIPSSVNMSGAKKLTRVKNKNVNVDETEFTPYEPTQKTDEISTQEVLEQENFANESYVDENSTMESQLEVKPQTETEPQLQQETEPIIEEVEPKPVKRGRGRPRKNPVVVQDGTQPVKRKRGRPRKNPIPEQTEITPVSSEGQEVNQLPGFEDVNINNNDTSLPGFEDVDVNNNDTSLPGFEDVDVNNNDTSLPGFEDVDVNNNDTSLPGFEDVDVNNNDTSLPGFEEVDVNNNDVSLPGFEDVNTNAIQQEENFVPGINRVQQNLYQPETTQETTVDFSNLLTPDKKIVTFVGTSKNGTSFIVNNLAQYMSSMGVNTAILDTTQNRNAYYIYTKNEEDLRKIATRSIDNLSNGIAEGVKVNNNLTVYTSLPEEGDGVNKVDRVLETLLKNHSLILIDTDFETPVDYFKHSQETYLIQSLDILTIQPLTAFLKDLKNKKVLEESKLRIVLNKTVRIRGINDKTIIGGMAYYNDPSMSFMTELFDRNLIKYVSIPFEEETYAKYLENIIQCDISLKGYSKMFMQTFRELANMVYSVNNTYRPPSSNTFSSNMNQTLNQMRNNY